MKHTLPSLPLKLYFAFKLASKTVQTKSSLGLALLLLLTVLFSADSGYAQCTSFVTVGSVGFSGTNAHDHSLAVDPAGVPYVAFQDGNNGNKASVMKYNGSTWVAVGSPGISVGVAYSIKMVIDNHSSIPYIWYYDAGNSDQLMVMKYESGSWTSVGTTGLTWDNSEANWTSMAVDPSGNPYISYMDYMSDYKISVKKYNGTSWVSVGSPGISSGFSAQTSIAINSSGVPYVLYAGHYGVKVQKFNGTDWVYVDSASLYGKFGDYPEIAFNNTDQPIIIFTGINLGGTAVMKYDGTSWSFLGSPGLIYSTAEIFSKPSMIVDPAGVPYVVCIDGSNLTDYRASVIRYNGTNWDFAGKPDFSPAIAEKTTIASNASGNIYMLYTNTGDHAVTVMKMYTIPAITGTNAICLGNSTTLSNATAGGTWISSNPASVTVGSATGIVSGISPGGATINYVPPIGCTTTFDLVVDANATAVTGPGTVNTGGHIVLFDTVSGGTWSSSNTGIATVGATGLVNGIALGTATISYSVTNSCGTSLATKTITVVATPPVCNTWWQVGTAVIPDSSNGTSDALIQTDASGTPYVLFTSQGLCVSKFNGSDWESVGVPDFAFPERFSESIVFDKNNTPYVAFGDGANDNYLTVMKFDGSSWVSVGSFGSMLPSGKVWETTSLAADNNGNLYLSYNDLVSLAYYILKYDGSAWQIIYTSGTFYSLINHDALLIDKLGNLNALIPDLNTNNLSVLRYINNTWEPVGPQNFSGDNTSNAILAQDPSGTRYVAFTDHSNGDKATVMKFNGSTWETVGTAGFSTGATYQLRMHIAGDGTPYVMPGYDYNSTIGTKKFDGVSWVNVANTAPYNSNAYDFAIDNQNVPYFINSEFYAVVRKLQPGIAPVTGSTTACIGTSITLSNLSSVGSWSSSNTAVATVAGWPDVDPSIALNYNSVIVTGVTAGTATISYTITSDCGTLTATTVVSINPSSAGSITGPTAVIAGSMITMSDAVTGGNWSSSNDAVATVNTSGVVTGISTGMVNITYTVTTACGIQTTYAPVTVSTSVCGSWQLVGGSRISDNPSGGVTGNSFVVTPDGTQYVVYSGVGNKTSVEKFNGSTWEFVGTPGFSPGVAYENSITVAADGTPYVSFRDIQNGWRATVMKFNGSNWVTVGGAGFSGDVAYNPSIAIAHDGSPYVAYTAGIFGDAAVVMKYTGSSWEQIGSTLPVYEGAGKVQLVIDDSERLNLLYYDYDNGTTVSRFAGTDWNTIFGVTSIATNGSIASNSYGKLYIAYTDNTNSYKTTVAKYNGSSWETVGATGMTESTVTDVRIVIDGTGAPVILYPDSTDGSYLSVRRYDGTSWSNVGKKIGISPDIRFNIAADNSGGLYAAYRDAAVANKLAVRKLTPGIGAITGVMTACTGGTTTINDISSGGTWSSSNTSVATVSQTTGAAATASAGGALVTGVTAGTATISYTITTDCGTLTTTAVVTIDPLSGGTITGATAVCVSGTTTLSNALSGGTWNSENTGIATINAITGIVTGVTGGISTISYSVVRSCGIAVSTKTVTVNTVPSAGTITGASAICELTSTTLSNLTPGGVWNSSNSSIATIGGGNGILTGVAAGSVTISYTVTTGCGSATTTKAVTVNAAPNAGAIAGATIICDGATTTLTNAATGGTWSSNNSGIASVNAVNGLATGIAAGNTSISYSVTNGCGTATTTKALTVNPAPDAGSITGTTTVCASVTTTLTNTATGGSWSSSNSSVATIGSSNGILTGVAAGNTDITYTITNSCGTATVTKAITVNAGAAAGSITGTASVCAGATTTLANATTGGVWSSNNSAIAAVGSSTGIVSGVAAGNTTITYTVTNGCGLATATKAVTVNALPDAGTITGTATMCPGATTTLSNAATSGVWSSNNALVAAVGSSTGIVTGIAGSNTTITYTVTNGCGNNATTKNVTVNTPPDAGTITGASSVGIGASITLADAALGGVWTSGATGIATVDMSGVVTGVAGGTATISYSVANLCGNATATKTITVNSGSITGSLTICAGTTATLSCAGGGTWSSGNTAVALAGGTTGVVTGVAAGTSTITYTLSGSSVTVVVTVSATPAAITGSMKACPGTATTLANTSTGGTWTSSNTSTATVDPTTGVVRGVAAGSVAISYTNAAGCAKTTSVIINPTPSAISGTLSACTGATATVSDATAGGLSWTSSNTAVANVNALSGVVTALTTGTSTITYTVSSGCMITATFTVNALPPAITGTLKTCAGTTTSLNDATVGGTWTSSYAAVATINTSGVVAGIAGGTTTITYSMGAGCNRTAVVTISPLPTAILGTPATCIGATTTLSNVGTGTWTSADMSVATVGTSGIVAGVAPGTTTISYAVASGCAASVIATVSAAPSASTGAATICMGSTTTLANATTGGTWASSNNGVATVGSASGIVTTLSSTGTVNITYSLGGGCRTVKNMTINAIPNAITGTASICAGNATTLSSSGGGVWSSSNMTVGTIGSISVVSGRFAGLSAGTSLITYAFATGCARTTTVTVNATPDAGTITSSGGFVINTATPPTSVMLSSTGDAGGTWTSNNTAVATIGAGTGTVTSAGAGVATISYTVTLGGCSARATHTVNVVAAKSANDNSSSTVFVESNVSIYPNPNKGTFTIKGSVASEENTPVAIIIVDMAGQIVYENNVSITNGTIDEQVALNANLANGMYMLILHSGNSQNIFHFAINK